MSRLRASSRRRSPSTGLASRRDVRCWRGGRWRSPRRRRAVTTTGGAAAARRDRAGDRRRRGRARRSAAVLRDQRHAAGRQRCSSPTDGRDARSCRTCTSAASSARRRAATAAEGATFAADAVDVRPGDDPRRCHRRAARLRRRAVHDRRRTRRCRAVHAPTCGPTRAATLDVALGRRRRRRSRSIPAADPPGARCAGAATPPWYRGSGHDDPGPSRSRRPAARGRPAWHRARRRDRPGARRRQRTRRARGSTGARRGRRDGHVQRHAAGGSARREQADRPSCAARVDGREHEFIGIGLIAAGVLLGLAIYFNLAGPLGRGIETLLGWIVGLGRFAVPDRPRRRRRRARPQGPVVEPVPARHRLGARRRSPRSASSTSSTARTSFDDLDDLGRRRRPARRARRRAAARRCSPRPAPIVVLLGVGIGGALLITQTSLRTMADAHRAGRRHGRPPARPGRPPGAARPVVAEQRRSDDDDDDRRHASPRGEPRAAAAAERLRRRRRLRRAAGAPPAGRRRHAGRRRARRPARPDGDAGRARGRCRRSRYLHRTGAQTDQPGRGRGARPGAPGVARSSTASTRRSSA